MLGALVIAGDEPCRHGEACGRGRQRGRRPRRRVSPVAIEPCYKYVYVYVYVYVDEYIDVRPNESPTICSSYRLQRYHVHTVCSYIIALVGTTILSMSLVQLRVHPVVVRLRAATKIGRNNASHGIDYRVGDDAGGVLASCRKKRSWCGGSVF